MPPISKLFSMKGSRLQGLLNQKSLVVSTELGRKILTFLIFVQVHSTWFHIDSLTKGWRFCPGYADPHRVADSDLPAPSAHCSLGPLPSFRSIMLDGTSVPPIATARVWPATRVSFVSTAPLKNASVSTVVHHELTH